MEPAIVPALLMPCAELRSVSSSSAPVEAVQRKPAVDEIAPTANSPLGDTPVSCMLGVLTGMNSPAACAVASGSRAETARDRIRRRMGPPGGMACGIPAAGSGGRERAGSLLHA